MRNPHVSVIIPNYNHEKFLKQRIDSILNQTYNNFEVIILDDKSIDNSLSVIEQYRNNSHVSHIVLNTQNSGSPFKQWNKGFELAKGDLIWIAESDDTCEPTFLQELVNEFESDDKLVLTFCKSMVIDANGNIIEETGMKESFHTNGKIFFDDYLYRHNFITNASSVVFKKNVIPQVDMKYTTFRGSGDWVFWIEITRQGYLAYVNKPLNYYRIHKTNTTTQELNSGRNETESIAVYQFMREKKYIGYRKGLRERIAHIYSIRYGKQQKAYCEEKKSELLKGWRDNYFLYLLTSLIHILQDTFNFRLINR